MNKTLSKQEYNSPSVKIVELASQQRICEGSEFGKQITNPTVRAWMGDGDFED